jgi:hypothetical protein
LGLGQRERNSAREKERDRERERERLSLTVSGGSPESSDWVNDIRWNGGLVPKNIFMLSKAI